MQLPEFSQLHPWRNLISLSSESSLFLLSLHSMRFFRRRASSALTGRASSSRSDGLRPLHLPMNILLSWFKSSVKGPPSSRPPLVSRACLLYGLSVTVDMFNISPSLQVNWHRNISYVRELITYSKGNSRWVFCGNANTLHAMFQVRSVPTPPARRKNTLNRVEEAASSRQSYSHLLLLHSFFFFFFVRILLSSTKHSCGYTL